MGVSVAHMGETEVSLTQFFQPLNHNLMAEISIFSLHPIISSLTRSTRDDFFPTYILARSRRLATIPVHRRLAPPRQ